MWTINIDDFRPGQPPGILIRLGALKCGFSAHVDPGTTGTWVHQEGPWKGPNPLRSFYQNPIVGVQPTSPFRQTHQLRWGGASPPPQPIGFTEGRGRVDPPHRVLSTTFQRAGSIPGALRDTGILGTSLALSSPTSMSQGSGIRLEVSVEMHHRSSWVCRGSACPPV